MKDYDAPEPEDPCVAGNPLELHPQPDLGRRGFDFPATAPPLIHPMDPAPHHKLQFAPSQSPPEQCCQQIQFPCVRRGGFHRW